MKFHVRKNFGNILSMGWKASLSKANQSVAHGQPNFNVEVSGISNI